MRRLAPVLVAGLALAACGGGHKASTTTTGSVSQQALIINSWEKFFAPQGDVSTKDYIAGRVASLQNGPKFKSVVEAFTSNPLARNVNAKVSSVTLQGSNKAKVVYTIKLGSAALPKQTGYAVRQNGVWKVSDASLCKLIALGGKPPSVCTTQ
ncbi:MAG TPA: hypothetical protein VF124_04215 [Gaiellaceae bacterium]